jgi:hypothetical protein
VESLQERFRHLRVRESINDNPRLVLGVTVFSVLLLTGVVALVLRPAPGRRRDPGRSAWFYDLNTGELFVSSSEEVGPIEAPSGPLPSGAHAGLRAHVYSYVLDPNESELFVGFLERPDPSAGSSRRGADMSDFRKWARITLIRGVDDGEWVAATSPGGREILQGLTRPNERGQTPIYQVPR